MTPEDLTSLAETWIAHWRAPEGTPQKDLLSDVVDVEWQLVREAPLNAWQLILRVLQLDSANDILEVLSAGPLEDLLSYHGDTVIGLVEAEARANPTFAKLLGGVWRNAMSPEVWARVQAVQDRRGWDGIAES